MIVTLGGAGLHWAKTPLGEIHWLCAGVLGRRIPADGGAGRRC